MAVTGCWTCRARRKKCGEERLACSTCTSLQLVCHGYGPRPEWMDGGKLEREKAQAFTAVVRKVVRCKQHERALQRLKHGLSPGEGEQVSSNLIANGTRSTY